MKMGSKRKDNMNVKELRAIDRLIYQQDNCRIFHCNSSDQRIDVLEMMEENCKQWILVVDTHPEKNDYFLIYFL
jgi:hypothetical protein